MFCKKCGQEIPDLTMYCPNCGASQFGADTDPVELKLETPYKGSTLIIESCTNLTNGITILRELTGCDVVGARKILSSLPAELFHDLSAEQAESYIYALNEAGITARWDGQPVNTSEPVQIDPITDEKFEEELEQFEKEQQLIMPAVSDTLQTVEEPSFEEQMEAFLKKPEEETPITENKSEEPISDEEFDAQMAAFLADDSNR